MNNKNNLAKQSDINPGNRSTLGRLSKAVLLGMSLTAASTALISNTVSAADIKNQTLTGSPSFVTGNLGQMTEKNAVQDLKRYLSSSASFAANSDADFHIKRQWTDSLGKLHTHFTQTLNGLNVYGTSVILHAESSTNTLTGGTAPANIYAINGVVATDSYPSLKATRAIQSQAKDALESARLIGQVNSGPELAYIYLAELDVTKLAWRMEVSWDNGNGDFGRDFVYFDPYTKDLLARHAQVHSAKSWKTYTLNGGSSTSAPGTLLCTNTQSCGNNAAAQRAHDGASKVYDYYSDKFGRDSINDNGLTLKSSVDMGESNAFWTGSQMIYGQAAGGLNDFTSDFDVIGHELTHGLTNYTADLIYQNASGALNEAWSDILGLSAEAYRNGTTSSTWMLGDGLYNQAGKALRYMDNPTKDGYSKDYYPERIPFVSNPNNQNDRGGVHGNSGIANLAYVLLVDGGSHPRNKTTAQVPGIGMAKAEQIFYRALNTYMNQNTNFAGARTATAQAAQDLYGNTEAQAVETAWCAVGVGSCPTDDDGGNTLTNGQTVSNLSASTGSDVVYTMDVPNGATDIQFTMSGGSGDADLYVKFGSTPTDNAYDCRPYKGGNSETCSVTNSGGTYYVRLKAYETFSGVSLTGSYTADNGGGLETINETVSNVSVSKGGWQRYTLELASGYADLTISISGGSGDADLFVNRGSQSTSSNYDCRPYKSGNNESCEFNAPSAGTWYIDLNGYSSASGVELRIIANP